MRPVPLSQVAAWCEGRLLGDDVTVGSVVIDSRAITGDRPLFVALRGENFDAHDFVEQAQAGGAVALLLSRHLETDLPHVLCADTQEALGEIAAGMQRDRPAVVLALTGSNGKTSVKSLLDGILSRAGRCYVNPGNRNNEIGLPLAVLDAPEDAQFAVYEMGAGKPGDIAYLASIAPPQVALVNNIAPAHLERMGSLLGVAETKGAIYEALSDDGVGVVNADDAFAPYFMDRLAGRRVFRFGIENDADVRADAILPTADGSRFRLHTPAGHADIVLPLPGRHSVLNALAASAMALAAGAPFDAIVAGLRHAEPVKGRQVAHTLGSGAVLVDDSYNANPGSVAAAIATLAQAGGEAWLVLGNMAELGEGTEDLHAGIGRQAKAAGLARLWTSGELAAHASRAFGEGGRNFTDQAALIDALRALVRGGVGCLVNVTRASALDKVVRALRADARTDAGQGGAGHAA
jgi:UDP-N-acetylmuramoyl-tripeptide--D-alanyl-D-alanine ligase